MRISRSTLLLLFVLVLLAAQALGVLQRGDTALAAPVSQGEFDGNELESQAEFPTVETGGSFHFWINVRNSGTTTWTAADGYGYRGTEQWLGRDGSVWRDVPPGDVLSFSEQVTVPTTPGKYVYGFVMRRGTTDFGYHYFLEATVVAPPTYTLTGHVRHNGVGLPGVVMNVAGYPAVTDGSGVYFYQGLHRGIYTVTPSKEGYTFAPPSQEIEITGNTTGVDFVTETAPPVPNAFQGRVTLNGAGLPGVTLRAGIQSALTNAGGDYSLVVAEQQWHTIVPALAGYRFVPTSYVGVPPVEGVDFAAMPAGSALLSGVKSITSGGAFSCALTTAGRVYCWGYNGFGQVGDGSTVNRLRPVGVSGLGAGVQSVDAGEFHACAVTASGAVLCWGANGGLLGNGGEEDQHAPVPVLGLPGPVRKITAGGDHSCALTLAGAVWCWGSNGAGQLGTDDPNGDVRAVAVVGLPAPAIEVSAGGGHTCAVTNAGAVWCWGYNQDGEVGDGTTVNRARPVLVSGLASGVTAVEAGGQHTCAVMSNGDVRCWGYNIYGQLGNGSTENRTTPVYAATLGAPARSISLGNAFTCALGSYFGVTCAGSQASMYGGFEFPGSYQAIGVGWENRCAVTSAGTVQCKGNNEVGQIGNGTAEACWGPCDVLAPSAFDGNELESQAEFPTVGPGDTFHFWINVRNSGTTTWRAADGYGYRGTEQWLGRDGSVWRDVPPGDVLSFSEQVTVPTTPGKYVYGFVMRRGTTDFGYHFFLKVTVTARPPVILIPGVMGSQLEAVDSLLPGCKERPKGIAWLDLLQMRNLPTLKLKPDGLQVANSCDVILPSGTVDHDGRIPFEIYRSFASALPGWNVFTFAYDWRLPIDDLHSEPNDAVARLDKFITDRFGNGPVILVGHSMGGLVARAYVSNSTRAARVAKVITVGTPYLGAPKLAYTLMTGKLDLLGSYEAWRPWAEDTKEVARNSPGILALLPSRAYADTWPYYVVDGLLRPDFTSTHSWFLDSGKEMDLLVDADKFHAQYDDLRTGMPSSLDYWILAAQDAPTISRVTQSHCGDTPSTWCYGTQEWSMGDGTVPRQSSLFPAPRSALRGDAQLCTYTADVQDHAFLLADASVRQDILRLLLDKRRSTASWAAPQRPMRKRCLPCARSPCAALWTCVSRTKRAAGMAWMRQASSPAPSAT